MHDDKKIDPDNHENKDASFSAQSRRSFLGSTLGVTSAAAVAGTVGGTVLAPQAKADDFYPGEPDRSVDGNTRVATAARIKRAAARRQLNQTFRLGPQLDNDDERRYSDQNFYASFFKTLPQNDYGEVDPVEFRNLRRAMRTGEQRDFDAIQLDPTAARKLANPQGAFRFEMTGLDSHATRMPPAPTFRSATTAAEMGEVYWQALTRDVPYMEYGSNPLIGDALNDLNAFSATVGPKVDGNVTAQTLFRGETPGDVVGPYISQLLLRDVPYGPTNIVQRYPLGLAGQDFMVDAANWISGQRRGAPAEPLVFRDEFKYL
jgi:hypothetical protein